MAGKIKRLQAEAEALQAEAKEFAAQAVAKEAEAAAKRAEAEKVSKDYVRKQCDAALAQLDAALPKKPRNAYFLFFADVSKSGVTNDLRTVDRNKKIVEMWANLGEQEKRKYKQQFEADSKRYNEWGSSEEGRRIRREREEVLRRAREASGGELAGALGALESSGAIVPFEPIQNDEAHESPAKHAAETSAVDTPVKLRRSVPARPPPAAGFALDEEVLEEAGKADMLAQLRNLAARPEVLALKKSSRELWQALQANGGMVNAAKRALVGA